MTLSGSWSLLAWVLDIGLYVVALAALAGLYHAGRVFGREFRTGYDETRHG